MRHDGLDARLLDALPEQGDLSAVERLAAPLIRVFREDLQCLASMNDRTVNGRIVIPVALIGLGTAGLAGAVAAVARRGRGGELPPPPEER